MTGVSKLARRCLRAQGWRWSKGWRWSSGRKLKAGNRYQLDTKYTGAELKNSRTRDRAAEIALMITGEDPDEHQARIKRIGDNLSAIAAAGAARKVRS